jgi:hypothetical protein
MVHILVYTCISKYITIFNVLTSLLCKLILVMFEFMN